MNAGVATSPCAVVNTPQRAPPPVCVTPNPTAPSVIDSATVYNSKNVYEKATRRRDLRRPLGRTRSIARVGRVGVPEPRPRAVRGRADSHREGRTLGAAVERASHDE